jgi:hypothetical protein
MVALWRRLTIAQQWQQHEQEMDQQAICLISIHSLVVCEEIWISWAILEELQKGQVVYQQAFGDINLDNEDKDHCQEVNLHFFKCWKLCQQCSSRCRDHMHGKKLGRVLWAGMEGGEGPG